MNISFIRLILIMLIPMQCLAAASGASGHGAVGIGEVAQNMMEPVNMFADFINAACFGLGAAFLLTALIKYVEHRRSPLMVPLSTVIFLLIAGVLLLLLPFAAYFTDSGVHPSLLK